MIPAPRRALAAVCLGMGGAAVVAALVTGTSCGPPDVPVTERGTDPLLAAPTGQSAGSPEVAPSDVTTLVIDRLGVRAPVDPVTVRDGELAVPDDPTRVGWWVDGARPGAAIGTVVLDGHVDYDGTTGALAVVPQLLVGDVVELRGTDGASSWSVQAVQSYPKATGLPDQLFTAGGPPRLALITCGGAFDEGADSYQDNVVAYAVPTPAAG